MVIWRVVVMYISVAVGAGVMIRTLGKDTLVTDRPGFGIIEKKIAVSGK